MSYNLLKLNKTEIATLLGVHVKSIENFYKQLEDPIPFHLDNNVKYYVWSDCLDWWVRRHTSKLTAFKPEEDLQAAKLAGQNLVNQKLQLDIDEKEGKLLDSSEVETLWGNTLLDIKNSLLNVGHLASGSILNDMTYSMKKELIDDLIFNSLSNVINSVQDKVITNE